MVKVERIKRKKRKDSCMLIVAKNQEQVNYFYHTSCGVLLHMHISYLIIYYQTVFRINNNLVKVTLHY